MDKKNYVLLMLVALVGGALGGALWSHFLQEREAVAESTGRRKIISAHEFRVVDEKGNVLGVLGQDGGIGELSFGRRGDPHSVHLDRMGLFCKRDQWSSRFYGYGFFVYHGEKKVPMLSVHAGPEGEYPKILFTDRSYKPRLLLTLHESGAPYVELRDGLFSPRVVLGYTELRDIGTKSSVVREVSSLVLLDRESNVIWSAP